MTQRPTWSEARHLGRQANAAALAERSAPPNPAEPLPQASQRWEAGHCIYCSGSSGLRVGVLAITGNVYFCGEQRVQFYADKKCETIHCEY